MSTIIENQYYIKQSRRYIPVERWDGFPSDGVWIVKDGMKSSRLVMKLDAEPYNSTKLHDGIVSRDTVYDAAIKIFCLKGINEMSVSDIANAIAEELFPNNSMREK